jgi:uncharacterized protein YhaN
MFQPIAAERQSAIRRQETTMKKAINLALEDAEIIELIRILMDDDAEAALVFLKTRFKGKARELLEGG